MFSLLVFVAILSILIVVHEFGHFIAARRVGVKVEKFSLGFGPKLWGITKNDTTYQICAIPLGGYIKMAGESRENFKGESFEYMAQKPKNRAKIVVAGATLNYILGLICLCVALTLGMPDSSPTVGEVIKGYPAEIAGIMPNDKILSIDGKEVNFWVEVVTRIHDKKSAKIDVAILRDAEVINLSLGTKMEVFDTPDGKSEITVIGIKQGEVKYSVLKAASVAARDYFNLTILNYKIIGMMLTGKMSFRQSMAGPFMIYAITAHAAKKGLGYLMYILSMLNLSLAIFNLLPFPLLDGGHIALIAIEKIRGRRLNKKVEESIERVGFGLIITLAVFVMCNDIVNLGIWDNVVKWVGSIKH